MTRAQVEFVAGAIWATLAVAMIMVFGFLLGAYGGFVVWAGKLAFDWLSR